MEKNTNIQKQLQELAGKLSSLEASEKTNNRKIKEKEEAEENLKAQLTSIKNVRC